jgi:hypothetical protein
MGFFYQNVQWKFYVTKKWIGKKGLILKLWSQMGFNLRADKFTKPLDLVKYADETIIKEV